MITLKSGKEIELNQAFNMDCLDFMRELPDNIIDLTVTSPPYDNLRTYNDSLEWNEDIWKAIIKDLFRITKDGGVVVWVVGDATINGSETGTSFKQALYFKECGFNLHDTMIYRKSNYVPLTHNRYEQEFEYMFVFAKGKPNIFTPILEKCKTAGSKTKKRTFYQDKYDNNTKESHSTNPVFDYKQKGNVWEYSTSCGFKGHPAQFPAGIVRDHLDSWIDYRGVFFDPFLGSFTSAIVCHKYGLNWLGCEKDPDYFKSGYARYENETKQILMDFN